MNNKTIKIGFFLIVSVMSGYLINEILKRIGGLDILESFEMDEDEEIF